MEELSVFKTFYSAEDANALGDLLKKNGIKTEVGSLRIILDKAIIGDILQGEVYVKIPGPDFEKANSIINEQIEQNLAVVEKDYYLYEFSNEELQEILDKADEWSNQDVIIAKSVLKERGLSPTEEQVKKAASQRMQELAKPQSEKNYRILIGYLLAFFFFVYGIFYGLMLYNAKKLLPNGQQVYTYNERIRNHAIIITIISAFLTTLVFIKAFTTVFGDPVFHIRF